MLHEVAHALAVIITPDVSLDEVKLTSHVKHSGHYTISGSFVISYAPLFVNTAVSLGAAVYLSQISPTESLQSAVLTLVLIYVALVTAFTALPSWEDATTPLSIIAYKSKSIKVIFLFPFLILGFITALPGIVISYLCAKSDFISLGLSLVYAVVIVLIGLDVIAIPVEEIVAFVEQQVETIEFSGTE